MKKQKSSTEYHGGRIKALVDAVIGYVKKHPEASNEDIHRALMQGGREGVPALKGYGDRRSCFNCDRSMEIAHYTGNFMHVLLLEAMARAVREETRKGVEFTKANRVHIDRLPIATSIKKQQSQAGYLGLIKKAASGASGYWVITAWGWKALRDEPIPEWVEYWNRHLIRRAETTTTFSKMRSVHIDKLSAHSARGRVVKQRDYRSELASFNPVEWVEYAGVVDQETIFRS